MYMYMYVQFTFFDTKYYYYYHYYYQEYLLSLPHHHHHPKIFFQSSSTLIPHIEKFLPKKLLSLSLSLT